MKISIITVCYNSEKTIARTIESVLCQKDVSLEYLIIDGASKDGTVKIAEAYRQKFSEKKIDYIIRSEKDDGIYDAGLDDMEDRTCVGSYSGRIREKHIFRNIKKSYG